MIRKLAMLGLAIGLAVIGLVLFVSLIAVADSVGTAFTYQGYLTDGGSAANADYDFEFGLYDALSGGNQEGITVTLGNVTVTDGLFTVELDFGSDVFKGDARWLQIGVRPGAETGSYTPIDPRTALTPAPYALHAVDAWAITGNSGTTHGTHFLGTTDEVSLTLAVSNTAALRLEPDATSPNVIGGHSDNSVTSGVVGATIGGGGASSVNANSVTDDYGTVGGGYRNEAGDDDGTTSDAPSATVGGGYRNTASGEEATVGGGYLNTASGLNATVGGGYCNNASNSYATVGGGKSNAASNSYATVGGGDSNSTSNTYATVGGGKSNTASYFATVGGGESNIASGGRATVGGGKSNTASDYYATVPGGYQAEASLYGQMAYASGQFAAAGDAQASLYVLRNATSDATETELYLDGTDDRLTVASGRTMTFDILVVARSDGGASAGYRVEGVIENVGGITSFIGTPAVTELGEDADWTVAVEDDDTYDALVIKVTGAGSTNIRWVATVRTAEVAW
jgi:hypothetical protein